jgi:UDP-glucose 4-epimerase
MRALVTGAAGFIGSTLVDRLLAEGHQVLGIDNFSAGISANLDHAMRCNELSSRRFTLVRADIQAPEVTDIVEGTNPHVIFHLAAQVDPSASVSDPQFDARSNVLGTINLCEASRRAGVQRIVYAASGESQYGEWDRVPQDESGRFNPVSPNAVAKLAGEMYLRAYAAMYGLAPICLALANVYGPRQPPHGSATSIAVLGSDMITGRPYTVHRAGAAAHDYVYVDDVVDAFVRAGGAPIDTTGRFDVGTGKRTTVAEVQRLISVALDGSSPPSFEMDSGDEWDATTLNITKAKKELGWKPTVDLADGIHRTTRWLRTTLEPETSALLGA